MLMNDSDGPGALELFSPFWLLLSMGHRYSPISETSSGFMILVPPGSRLLFLVCRGCFSASLWTKKTGEPFAQRPSGLQMVSTVHVWMLEGVTEDGRAGKWSGIYCSPRLLSNYVQLYDSSKTLEYRQDFQSQDVEVIDKQFGTKMQKSSDISSYKERFRRERR